MGPSGLAANGDSWSSALSDDGNVVVFASFADNLVAGDTAGTADVFVRDVAADTLECVSLSTSGAPGTGDCFDVRVSGDGRYVAFASDSPSLVAGDTNATYDVFWFDRQTKTMKRVDVDSTGAEGKWGGYEVRLSQDGQIVMFTSGSALVSNDLNNAVDVYLHDVATGITERVSVDAAGNEGSGNTFSGGITDDDRYVVFSSYADDLDPNDGNPGGDIFLKDRQTGALTLISLDPSGGPANGFCFYSTISGDGKFVAFVSYADNLVPVDRNRLVDVFVRNLVTGITTRESKSSDGTATGGGSYPQLSSDGRYVAFSTTVDLTPNPGLFIQPTVYVRDRTLNWTMTPAADSSGAPSLGMSDRIAMSRDGRFTSFSCDADDLDPADVNGAADVFRHETNLTPAASANFGAGLAGTLGVPTLASTLPRLHRDCTLAIGNSLGAPTFAVLFLGDANGTVPTNLGASILLLPSLLVPLSLPAAGLVATATLPIDEFLFGDPLALQVLEIDPGAIHGVSFTPRLDLTLGR